MNDFRKPHISELRPGDKLIITNKDVDVSSEFLVDERKFLWLFPFKVLVELKLYADEIYPLSYLKRKEIHWKLAPTKKD